MDRLAFADFAFEDVDAEWVENFFLDGAPERTRSVNRIETFARKQFLGRIRQLEGDLLLLETLRQAAKLDLNNLFQVVLTEPVENDDFIHAIEKLWAEMRAQRVGDESPARFFRFFLHDVLRTDVRGHDDDRVFEIDRSPLPVRDSAVVQHLQ